jgi:sarcosine oxidase subunit delta
MPRLIFALAFRLSLFTFHSSLTMKLLTCPINGPRPLSEFVYGGEVRPMPDAAAASDAQWADYVFNRRGEPGVHQEWWYHLASGTWFIAERDNVSDQFLRTYLYADRPPADQPVNPI